MRTPLSAVVLLSVGLGACASEEPGHLVHDTVWRGEVVLTSDVFVDPGVTLTIEPGTRITITADRDDLGLSQLGPADEITARDPTGGPDAGGHEYQKGHIGIIVAGNIVSLGTAEAPIIFTSSAPQPSYTDWVGISAAEGRFAYTVVEWAIFGIGGGTGPSGLTLDHCHIRHLWGACTAFNGPVAPGGERWVRHSTIEDCGHEAIDTHSPGALEIGWSELRRTQAGLNLHDDIEVNAHHLVVTDSTFPVLLVDARSVLLTQSTLNAHTEDPSRWKYQGYSMPDMGQGYAAGIFVSGAASKLIFTNSIIFDSPVGLRDEAPAAALQSGYLNLDGVVEPYAINAAEGAGGMAVDSRFVDRAQRDVRLALDSPVRGQGNPADGRPDLGAFGGAQARDSLGWRGPATH